MSDDGEMAVVVIALLGNPFSPRYASARQRGPVPSALDFSSMNVALYARGASAWTLAERSVAETSRTASDLAIGGSSMRWEGDRLIVTVDDRTTPLGRSLRGTIVVRPEAHTNLAFSIDDRDEHRWWPIAPLARVDVDFQQPRLRFSGHGYYDANAGETPLESAFDEWSWSRARRGDSAILTYDVACASGAQRSLALAVARDGSVDEIAGLEPTPLPRTLWRLPRATRGDAGHRGRIIRSLEDGPFYARALVETQIGGQTVTAMHETLAARRLKSPLVRLLARCRMRHHG